MYRIPDRWLEYSRCGEVIDETGILASKTPLKKGFHKCKERPEGIPPSEEFTPIQLVDYCKQKGQRIGLVVDLTFSYRYYDPKELRSLGIQHAKIACPGQEIPDEEIYANFAAILEEHLTLDDPGVIVVHCTHGVNRTGYLVCKFLIDHFKYTADDAIKAFNSARGHSMERENYISDIQDYWRCVQSGDFPPEQSCSQDSWEPQGWSYDHHHQPHSEYTHTPPWHYHNSRFDFYSQPYHPYGYNSYAHCYQGDFYSAPNSYTRFRGRPNFAWHQRGRSNPGHYGTRPPKHQHTSSGDKLPQRNQLPAKHQHFSSDQPTPKHQFSEGQSALRNQPPSKLQNFSADQTPEDVAPPRNQPPPCHQHFSSDQMPPKELTLPSDQSPCEDQSSLTKETLEDQHTPKDQISPRNLRPRRNQPARSAHKPSRGKHRKQ